MLNTPGFAESTPFPQARLKFPDELNLWIRWLPNSETYTPSLESAAMNCGPLNCPPCVPTVPAVQSGAVVQRLGPGPLTSLPHVRTKLPDVSNCCTRTLPVSAT